jgi:hypothetical protein
LGPAIEHDPEVTPKTSRQVRDYGKNKSPTTRRRYNTIAKGYVQLEFELATKNNRIAALEAEVARLDKKRKRKAIPNPNKRFMLMGEAIAAGEPNAENPDLNNEPVVEEEGEEEVNEGIDEDNENDEIEAPIRYTRPGRSIKRPDRLMQ